MDHQKSNIIMCYNEKNGQKKGNRSTPTHSKANKKSKQPTHIVTVDIHPDSFVCLFDLILYVPSTIFQLNRDGSSWVEPVLSWDHPDSENWTETNDNDGN